MRKVLLVDIDNCIANTNEELQKMGYRTDIYPAPIPLSVFEDGSIFKNPKPMNNVINTIEKIYVKGKDICIFFTARSDNDHIHKITQEWIVKNTNLEYPVYYTMGYPKGKVLKSFFQYFGDELLGKYDFVVFDDSPHEIMSYINIQKEMNINMDFYIPDWEYNSHIDIGRRIYSDRSNFHRDKNQKNA